MNTVRKLATIQQIEEISSIPNADSIVMARIQGWNVVIKLNEFKPGDLCVYFEIDTMLDVTDPRFAWLAPRGIRTDPITGRSGHVLRTIKLRGQYSQGLALPLNSFPELAEANIGDDVTEIIGVTKWDPPLPIQLSGVVRGKRPSWIPITDEERLQNIPEILTVGAQMEWLATEKIDGTSTTFYVDPDSPHKHGVCSRNLDIFESRKNTMWLLARDMDIHVLLSTQYPGKRVALQGETYGVGIQGNPLKINNRRFAAFTLIVDGIRVPRNEWPVWIHAISVPVHKELEFPRDLTQALTDVHDLKSTINPKKIAEGIVWRSQSNEDLTINDQVVRASFKVISNRYLLKQGN